MPVRAPRGRRSSWPILAGDSALAAGLCALILLTSGDAALDQHPVTTLNPAGYVLMLIAACAVAVRRLAPLVSLGVTVSALTAYLAAGYPLGPGLYPLLFPAYAVANALPPRRSATACAIAALGSGTALLTVAVVQPGTEPVQPIGVIAAWSGSIALPWALGALVRLRREDSARDALAEARARDEELRRQAIEQRLRLARDVHDSIGHSLAVIAMQAGIGLHLLDERPAEAERALRAVRAQSTEALGELRRAIDSLRATDPQDRGSTADPAAMDAPATATGVPSHHGLASLDGLLTPVRAAGVAVNVSVSGLPVGLAPAVDAVAYRIVQEALTNALRHAGPNRVDIELRYTDDSLDLRVRDSGRVRGDHGTVPGQRTGGHGLPGLRERAIAVGGSLAARRAGDGFEVTAHLPHAGHAADLPT